MKVLSLFANVGFGELYFKKHNFNVVVANELLSDRVDFYKKLHPDTNEVICGDIRDANVKDSIVVSCEKFGPIDMVVATPPCQGMSIANATKKSNDLRNTLITHAMDIFNRVNARYMLIENVPQMGKTYINYEGNVVNIIDFIQSQIPDNYICHYNVLNAKDYGTPQSRSRSICLISEGGKWKHSKPNKKCKTVRDAIGNAKKFPSLSNAEHSDKKWHFAKDHNPNHIKWMSHTPEGKSAFDNKIHYPQKDGRRISGFSTTYKRMHWDKPAPTVTMTNGSISSQNNVHPGLPLGDGIYSDPRVLSIREILAICGLPITLFDGSDFVTKNKDGSFEYYYSSNFIRKVLGEIFLPKMAESLIRNV